MARGSASKDIITEKILDTFEGSFKYDKEIRIPIMEEGSLIQIKVVLTAAKTNVENGSENSIPNKSEDNFGSFPDPVNSAPVKATEEEKATVAALMAKLNL